MTETREEEPGSEVRSPWAKDSVVASTKETREGEGPTSMGMSQEGEGTTKVVEEARGGWLEDEGGG